MSWKYGDGLFGCFNNIPRCLYGTFCPCCLNAQTYAKIRGEECGIFHFFNPHSIWYNRKDLGEKPGDFVTDLIDCAISIFCYPCATCQDASKA